MAHLQYYTYEGYGVRAQKELWYSQAVRVGDIIECSGQGGWDRTTEAMSTDVTKQIEQAFENVSAALKAAGSNGWEDVFSVRTYHVPLNNEALHAVGACMKKWCPNHQPISTVVGVQRLAFDEMKVEVEVRAHVPVEKKQ